MIEFAYNGENYRADKGYLYVEKDGESQLYMLDVFKKQEPTPLEVLEFVGFIRGIAEGRAE